jgi:hypothetical protein
MHVFFILSSLASRLVSCLAWIFDHGRLLTGTLVLGASLIALYRYGYLGVVFGWAIAAILLVGLVAWAYIARLIKDAIDEFLVFAIPIRWERDGCSK